ncbi:MAG: T9SS type A sorting domain-containing protein [Chitinophagaceae bacterium]|jgi:uncharacterized delta-60 repeat protein
MKAKITLIALLLLLSQLSIAQYQEGLDPSFGAKGISLFSESYVKESGFYFGAIQPDGKIVAFTLGDIIRLNNDGTVDKSFGKDGFLTPALEYEDGTPITNMNISWASVQNDGKLIFDGYDADLNKSFLFRTNYDGSIDMTFGKKGKTTDPAGGVIPYVQPDGKIVAITYAPSSTQKLVRYHSNGVTDSSFGINGVVLQAGLEIKTDGIEVMADGRIVTLLDDFGAARYLPDGRPDSSFNHVGHNYIFDNSLGGPLSTSLAVCPDGKVWVAGFPIFGSPTPFILGRLKADGNVDSSFNGIGYKEYAHTAGDQNKCRDILLQPDGKVILAGKVFNASTNQYNFGLIRIHPDGREDSTFGIDGRLMTQTSETDGSYKYDDLSKLLLQTDQKILGLGTSFDKEIKSSIVRYYSNGKTSITEIPKSDQSVSIYPNPTDSKVYYKLPYNQKAEQLSLLNMQGQLMLHTNQPKQNEIETGSLPNGCYILRIRSGTAVFTQKLCKYP